MPLKQVTVANTFISGKVAVFSGLVVSVFAFNSDNHSSNAV